MSGKAIIRLLMDRPVAYRPDLARILGGVKCAVFMCQMLYWTGKGKRADGFIWKTRAELEIETGLTRHEQDGARKKLKTLGVLDEKRAGIPAKMHYRVRLDVLESLISAYYDKQDCQKVANCTAENQQTNSESTRESTSHGADAPAPPAEKQEEESTKAEPQTMLDALCELKDGTQIPGVVTFMSGTPIPTKELAGEDLITEFFGEKPERQPVQKTPHWTDQMAQGWANWGRGSDEFERQVQKYGENGYRVKRLGYEFEKLTGLHPVWSDKKEIKRWCTGLWKCLQAADYDAEIVLEAARELLAAELTVSSPWSVREKTRALAALGSREDKCNVPAMV